DDDCIQAATLKNGSANVTFSGHLQVIDMSREVELPVKVTIIGGHTYVPADFFVEFFNEVKIENGVVTIAPQMAYIDGVNSYGASFGG
ncbi:MAG: copper amine oxidase N-terminal domain-containing protein, partial [Clostridiales bacterium]|nr:copper amine oxidase N-terminal domain-containing protein [Clostridiales bacterium]